MKRCNNNFYKMALAFSIIVILLSSCQFNIFGLGTTTPSASIPFPPPPEPQPMAEVFFATTIPSPLLPGETLVLSVVDEVTGLVLNPTNYIMQPGDSLHYYIAIPFAVNSVVKYRYMKQSSVPIFEDNYKDLTVRYRLYFVGGPGEVLDTITSWNGNPYTGDVGRITGRVVSETDGAGIPDILICAGGNQTLSDSNGEFVLEGIAPGTQNLVAYSLDGRFQPFQQGAKIIADKRTPVNIRMASAPLVNVVFSVIVPANTVPSAPIHLAGNLFQLGNSFGDLKGGVNGVAVNMPVLTPMLDGRYTLSMMLPAGADIQYKYTLGDGFWNAEHSVGGDFNIRQLIVPNSGGVIQDVIETWQSGPSAPILFEVTAPAETPKTDIVSIQFNPYGWTEPLQMWPLGNNRWVYQLFSPLNMLGSFEYRYCRNDQCGISDDAATSGNSPGRFVSTSLTPQDLQVEIKSWKWVSGVVPEIKQEDVIVQARDPGFWAGVEFQSKYNPTWRPWIKQAFQNISSFGSNWIVLSPTWTYQGNNPFEFSLIPGQDQIGFESIETINAARAHNLNTAIFPTAKFPLSEEEWWKTATRDTKWWDAWFARYRSFSLYYADLAMANNVQTLIIGGNWLGPALPGGILSDGSSSNVPADVEARWSSLVAEIRQHYNGQIFWAINYPGGLTNAPGIIYELDGIYLLWHAPLSIEMQPSVSDMQNIAAGMLDNEIRSFQMTFQKPLVISVSYPSITGTSKACIPDEVGGCVKWSDLDQPSITLGIVEIDMQAQFDAYQALLRAVNERSWISGFISRGYYPPVALQDPSNSINGKPTEALLNYWFPRFIGIIN
jgi:hypothetical protein